MSAHFSNKGFNIVEVLVAVVLMGVSMAAMAGLQITSIKGNVSGHNRAIATEIIIGKIQEFRSYPYFFEVNNGVSFPDDQYPGTSTILDPGTHSELYNTAGVDKTTVVQRYTQAVADTMDFRYQLSWTIVDDPVDQKSATSKKKLSISITWADTATQSDAITFNDMVINKLVR